MSLPFFLYKEFVENATIFPTLINYKKFKILKQNYFKKNEN